MFNFEIGSVSAIFSNPEPLLFGQTNEDSFADADEFLSNSFDESPKINYEKPVEFITHPVDKAEEISDEDCHASSEITTSSLSVSDEIYLVYEKIPMVKLEAFKDFEGLLDDVVQKKIVGIFRTKEDADIFATERKSEDKIFVVKPARFDQPFMDQDSLEFVKEK